jgi:hypothetical protein
MKVGDLVMFVDKGTYAKWFFGQLAVAKSVSQNTRGAWHCRVAWLQPVKYHDSYTTVSDFRVDKFEVCSDRV